MEKKEIFIKLQDIFQDVFDNDQIEITRETVAEDIEEWDSLAHIQLIKEITKVFNIEISSKEFLSWENVGVMLDSIESKIA